jgi:putative transposase
MPNHVHLVVVPSRMDSMPRVLQVVHGQYAQRVNRMRAITGHLWQGRYYASALDTAYLLNATRYVERNPVEAGLVTRAQDYRWSSAAAHCGTRIDPLLEPVSKSGVLRGIADWSKWLAKEVPDDCRKLLQRNARLGLPCGSANFVEQLEKIAGRDLQFRRHGGQPKK